MSIAALLSPPADNARLTAWRPALLALLAGAALAELLLLRFALRVGPMLRGNEEYAELFRRVQGLGVVALNLATLLGTALLALMAIRWLGQPRSAAWVAALAALGFAGTMAAAVAGGAMVGTAWTAGMSIMALTTAWIAMTAQGRFRLLPTLVLVTYVVVDVSYLSQTMGVPESSPGFGWMFFLGETLAVLVAVCAAPAEWPGWQPRAAALALVAVALFSGLVAFQRPIASAMAMWNFSFSLFLPLPLYAAALGSYAYAVLGLWSRGGLARQKALGLLLIALGGLKLDYTYYQLLAVVGFLALLQAYEAAPAADSLVSPGNATKAAATRASSPERVVL